ncbi:MAG: hypothetical protein AAFR05_10135 [Bacteroidota bacterium]
MIKRIQANRQLMLQVRNKIKDKQRALQKQRGAGGDRRFNHDHCNPQRPAVRDNRRRVAREVKKIRREDRLKSLLAVVLTGLLLFLGAVLWNQLTTPI